MVNTFVTSFSNGNYRESAESLDKVRLWKQCLEAYQILSILKQLKSIAKKENKIIYKKVVNEHNLSSKKIANRFLKRCAWVKETRKNYLDSDYRYICIDGVWEKRNKNDLPLKLYKSKDK